MVNPWKAYFDAMSLALQAQQVVALRMLKLCDGGPLAALEAQRMVGEKAIAAMQAGIITAAALAQGKHPPQQRTLAPYRRAIKANRRRLGRRRPA